MGPSWHTGMVHWYITWPLYMYVVLHTRNWHIVRIKNTSQYIPKAFAFPKTTTEDYLKQAIGEIISTIRDSPEDTYVFVLWWCNKKYNQSDYSHFVKKKISAPHINFTATPHATTEPELKYSTTRNNQYTITISEGGTGFVTYEGANTRVSTHIASKRSAFHTP